MQVLAIVGARLLSTAGGGTPYNRMRPLTPYTDALSPKSTQVFRRGTKYLWESSYCSDRFPASIPYFDGLSNSFSARAGTTREMAGAPLAVCLTGQLRWPELTLANVQQHLLARLGAAYRLYFVGPADESYNRAKVVLRARLKVADACAYHPMPHWIWSNASLSDPSSFEVHGSDICTRRRHSNGNGTPPRLIFNVAWLPFFRRCAGRFAKRFPVGDEAPHGYPNTWNRGPLRRKRSWERLLCSSAVSLVMQLWQSTQCLNLLQRAEQHSDTRERAVRHAAVLRLRTDLFFFAPVRLPNVLKQPAGAADARTTAAAAAMTPRFSLMEETCTIERALVEMRRKARAQFFQDFWILTNRAAMVAALRAPLDRLLQAGRDSTLALAKHDRPPVEFAVNPVMYGLNSRFNSSHCVRQSSADQQHVGIVRVNPAERCFMVQLRVGKTTLSGWTEVDLATGAVSAKCGGILRNFTWGCTTQMKVNFQARLPIFDTPRLRSIANVYERCLGLKSNLSCPRVTGDKLLKSGSLASCFRAGAPQLDSQCGRQELFGNSNAIVGYDCVQHGLEGSRR